MLTQDTHCRLEMIVLGHHRDRSGGAHRRLDLGKLGEGPRHGFLDQHRLAAVGGEPGVFAMECRWRADENGVAPWIGTRRLVAAERPYPAVLPVVRLRLLERPA